MSAASHSFGPTAGSQFCCRIKEQGTERKALQQADKSCWPRPPWPSWLGGGAGGLHCTGL